MELQKINNKRKGVLLVILSALIFTISMSLTKFISKDLNNAILVCFRSAFSCVVASAMFAKIGVKEFKTKEPFFHAMRALLIFLAVSCTYYSYRNFPLILTSSIGMTEPSLICLLSIIFLKEKVSLKIWALIFLGYVGAVMTVFKINNFDEIFTAVDYRLIFPFAANFFAANATILTKKLSKNNLPSTLLFYGNVLVFFVSLCLAIFYWTNPSKRDWILLTSVAVLIPLMQYCKILALRFCEASFIAPFEYLRLFFFLPIGFFVFNERPSMLNVFGSLVIVLSTYLLVKEKIK